MNAEWYPLTATRTAAAVPVRLGVCHLCLGSISSAPVDTPSIHFLLWNLAVWFSVPLPLIYIRHVELRDSEGERERRRLNIIWKDMHEFLI